MARCAQCSDAPAGADQNPKATAGLKTGTNAMGGLDCRPPATVSMIGYGGQIMFT